MDLFFSVHNLAKFSSNPGEDKFEGLVHLLRYIRYNKNLGLIYYARIKEAPLSGILIQASINDENQLILFYDYIL